MVNKNGFSILRQFLMEYGSIMGICWTVVFALYVIGFRSGNGIFLLLAFLGLLAILTLEFYFGIRVKKRTLQLSLSISPLFTFVNIFSMFMYACLLCGAMEYIYFQIMDKGSLFTAIEQMMSQSDVKQTYYQMGMKESYDQAISLIAEISTLSALDKTILFFNQNFFTALIIAVPVTVANRFYKPKDQTQA
ncbi:MAG: DUF4199 domain-containing protein [Bacteroidaceae bacterium]|nr:DUF4199 domain-containing protein [Bacteroidaceae bacterium]